MDEKENKLEMKRLSRKLNAKAILLIVSVCVLVASVSVLLILMAKNGVADPAVEQDGQEGEMIAISPNVSQPALQTGSSRGFPVSFSGGKILDIKPIGNGVYVLTKDALCFISSSGDFRTPVNHGYSEPVLQSNGKYAALFDRISGKFMLLSERKVLFQEQTENGQQINTVALHENGSIAVAAKGVNYASLLTLYSKSGKILFSWECAKEYIVAIDISQSGKDLLCAALQARNGEVTTKLYQLNIHKTETVWEYAFAGAAAMDCRFSGKHEVIVACNDRRIRLDTRREEPEPLLFSYPADLLCRSTDEKGNTAFACQKFGSFDTYEISLIDQKNELRYTAETDEKVLGLFCRNGRVYALTEHAVLKLGARGHISRITALSEVSLGFAISGKNAYHYALNTLYKN